MEISKAPYNKKLYDLLSKIFIKIPFYFLSSSRNRALVFSAINLILAFLELRSCVIVFLSEDGIKFFLDAPWKYMLSAFGFGMVPAIMGLVIFMSILSNDAKMVHAWCIMEILVLVTSTAMTAINSDVLEELTELHKCILSICFLFKVAAVFAMYNFLMDLAYGQFDDIIGFDSGCYFDNPGRSSSNKYIRNEIMNLQNYINETKIQPDDAKLDMNYKYVHKYSLRP